MLIFTLKNTIMKQLTFLGFVTRLMASFLLVFSTFNPLNYNFFHWVIQDAFTPLKGLLGIILLIGWVIFVRASLRSLGVLGFGLIVLFFGFFLWLLIDYNFLELSSVDLLIWIGDIIVSIILAIGMSWSHIRRQMSGQLDTYELDD
jgi:hypothetical protein